MNIEYDKFIEWAQKYTDYPTLQAKAKEAFNGWDIKEVNNPFEKGKAIVDVMNDIIVLAEKASRDLAFLSNRDKLAIVVKFLDDAIHLPFYLEWADQIVIQHMITAIVEQYNRFYGHKWLEVIDVQK